jgi:hypothetical protein
MSDELIGKLIAEKYRIDGLVRESDAGDLYNAHHDITGEPLLLSLLPRALAVDERWTRRFIDSARSTAAVTDENVLRLTDFGTDRSSAAYAVYEKPAGKTLADVIATDAPFDEARSLSVARQVASAVAAFHERGVIHGRLDPQQIYVDTDNGDAVRVFGFGGDRVERFRGADPRYLAPEQLGEFHTASERSDVYSIGVILYQMLSGSLPYAGSTAAEIRTSIAGDGPAALTVFRRDLRPDVEPIVLTALSIDPELRYKNAAAFAEDLAILSGSSRSNTAAAGAAPKRDIWKTAFVVLAGTILLASGLIYATYIKGTDPTKELVADEGSLPVQPIGPATGAQEESLAKMPALTDAELLAATTATMELPPGTLPGGDGYNPWASGSMPPPGAPPPGAPFPQYVAPPGQIVTVDPAGGSQFMPNEGGVILVPVPVPANNAPRAGATPRPTPADDEPDQPETTATPAPRTGPTPRPLATPPPKNPAPAANRPSTRRPAATPAPADRPSIDEL